jgi:hypothetical protein
MGQRFNPAGNKVYEALIRNRRHFDHGRLLDLPEIAKPDRTENRSLRIREYFAGLARRDSGLVWEAPRLRRQGRCYVWASSSARNGAMVGFDGRPCLLGGSEHRAMDAQAIERSRDLPVRVEVTV